MIQSLLGNLVPDRERVVLRLIKVEKWTHNNSSVHFTDAEQAENCWPKVGGKFSNRL